MSEDARKKPKRTGGAGAGGIQPHGNAETDEEFELRDTSQGSPASNKNSLAQRQPAASVPPPQADERLYSEEAVDATQSHGRSSHGLETIREATEISNASPGEGHPRTKTMGSADIPKEVTLVSSQPSLVPVQVAAVNDLLHPDEVVTGVKTLSAMPVVVNTAEEVERPKSDSKPPQANAAVSWVESAELHEARDTEVAVGDMDGDMEVIVPKPDGIDWDSYKVTYPAVSPASTDHGDDTVRRLKAVRNLDWWNYAPPLPITDPSTVPAPKSMIRVDDPRHQVDRKSALADILGEEEAAAERACQRSRQTRQGGVKVPQTMLRESQSEEAKEDPGHVSSTKVNKELKASPTDTRVSRKTPSRVRAARISSDGLNGRAGRPDIGDRFPSYFWQQKRMHDGTPMVAGRQWEEERDLCCDVTATTVKVLRDVSTDKLEADGELRVAAVNTIMEMCSIQEKVYGGFLLKDACHLGCILKKLLSPVERFPEFKDPILTIMSMLRKPMLICTASEWKEHLPSVFQLANTISCFVSSAHDRLAESAIAYLCQCMTAADWPSIHLAVRNIYLYQPVPYTLHEAVVETSYGARLMAINWEPGDERRRHAWTQEALLIFMEKDVCRQQIALSKKAKHYVLSLHRCSVESRTHQVILMLISNLLMYEEDHVKCAEELASRECLQALRHQLHLVLKPNLTQQLLNTRNQLVHIIMLLACHVPGALFAPSGLLGELCILATFTEVKSNDPLVRDLVFREYPKDEDFMHADITMKMSLLLFFAAVATTSWNLEVMQKQLFLSAVLEFLRNDVPDDYPFVVENFFALQQVAVLVVVHLAPAMAVDILENHGTTRLLMLIEYLCDPACTQPLVVHDKTVNPGYSSQQQMSLLQSCFQVLYILLQDKTYQSHIQNDLVAQGAVPQLRSFVLDVLTMRFSKLMKRDHSQEKEVSHMLHCAVHHAMECLTLLHCDSHPQYDPSDADSFAFLDTMLSLLTGDKEGSWIRVGTSDESLPVAFLNSIWLHVVTDSACEEQFFESGMTYKLLDALNKSGKGLSRGTLTRILSDLSDNGGNITHFQTWGVAGTGHRQNIYTLLLRHWRENDRDEGVQRTEKNNILDYLAPLLTTKQIAQRRRHQEQLGQPEFQTLVSSIRNFPALAEVKSSSRAAIANILLRVGPPAVPLSDEDSATFTLVQCHLDMKVVETVQDVVDVLDRRNIPVPQECLSVLREYFQLGTMRSKAVQAMHVEEKISDTDVLSASERSFYDQKLEEMRAGEQLSVAKKERQRMREVTSDVEALKRAAKSRQRKVEAARARNPVPPAGMFHDVILPTLRTSMPSEEVSIECTPSLLASVRASRNSTVRQNLAKTLLHFREDEYEALPSKSGVQTVTE